MEKVTFGADLPGYSVGPLGAPAIIVLQEWWGVTDMIKEQAEMLSQRGGFRCLVPDLYKGKIGVDAEEASHLMGQLDFQTAVEEIQQAAAFLKQQGAPKVGVVGFCMGGALSFAAAAKGVGVECAAPFYGIPSAEYFDLTAIEVPVQANFGRLDKNNGFSDPTTAEATVKKMKDAGCDVELILYESGGHAFMNYGMMGGEEKLKSLGFPIPTKEDVNLAW
eukprot:CAMPEP_0196572236 /NCGR_PEP_ID=MMETSP1081-20130531/2316_1 /TAXON_ID=36882 /ORGANISM="Pyramimonas amylifera, Strain CCMP720" /LENGTH=219 /DNA_ID=CAMNT_0041889481 /DNA_START=796 /DNA_END=1452 /DNA_ORIENTATION=+